MLSQTTSFKKLSEEIGVSPPTLRLYFCRAEFSHIKTYWGYVENITDEDIEKLKEFAKIKKAKYHERKK